MPFCNYSLAERQLKNKYLYIYYLIMCVYLNVSLFIKYICTLGCCKKKKDKLLRFWNKDIKRWVNCWLLFLSTNNISKCHWSFKTVWTAITFNIFTSLFRCMSFSQKIAKKKVDHLYLFCGVNHAWSLIVVGLATL